MPFVHVRIRVCDADARVCACMQVMVGFHRGAFKDSEMSVASPAACTNVPAPMLALAERFGTFLQTSPLPIREFVSLKGALARVKLSGLLLCDCCDLDQATLCSIVY